MKLKKVLTLFGVVCILNTMVIGCGSAAETAVETEKTQTDEISEEGGSSVSIKDNDENMEQSQENTTGKWQILESDVAAAVDADFLGKVWKMEEDSFFIVEKEVKILEDGSLSYSSPSSSADIPDSQLIHVIFEEDTAFYIRSNDGDGENQEYTQAGFQELKEHMSVEMKGSFVNDEFHATEIRFF